MTTHWPGWILPSTRESIHRVVEELRAGLENGLEGVLLVGSIMNPARQDRERSPELIAVVSNSTLANLPRIAHAMQGALKRRMRVRVLTRSEIERSVDVFTVELADWKARHVVLMGVDPLAELRWTPTQMRHGLELELRALSRRIRNRVLTGIASHGDRDDPHQAVIDGLNTTILCCYLSLQLVGATVPTEESALLSAVAQRLDTPVSGLLETLASVRGKGGPWDPAQGCAQLLGVVDPLIHMIDSWEAPT